MFYCMWLKRKGNFVRKETICLYIWDWFVCLTSLQFLEQFRKLLFLNDNIIRMLLGICPYFHFFYMGSSALCL